MPFVKSKPPLPTRSLRFLRAAAGSTSSALCLHHAQPFFTSEQNLSLAEKQRVSSRSCTFQDLLQCSDCALSWAMRLLQSNEQLSRLSFWRQWVGSGVASLSAARVRKNATHCPKEICSTFLSKESMPCVKIQASSPYQKLEVTESGSTLHQLCIVVVSVASCLQKIELWYPRFGLQDFDCELGCPIYATAESQWRIVEIQLLASVDWQWGCRPFSCPCSQNVTHCPKEICPTCLSKEPIPAIPSWNSKHPIPTRSLAASCPSILCSCRKKYHVTTANYISF